MFRSIRYFLKPTHFTCVLFLLVFVTNLHAEIDSDKTKVERTYQHAVVAADHPLASAAGLEILKKGVNVVDAAVATFSRFQCCVAKAVELAAVGL